MCENCLKKAKEVIDELERGDTFIKLSPEQKELERQRLQDDILKHITELNHRKYVRRKRMFGTEVIFVVIGNKIIAKTVGRKRTKQVEVNCNSNDNFDENIGFKLAFWRLQKGLRKELLNKAKRRYEEAEMMIKKLLDRVELRCKLQKVIGGRPNENKI